MKYFFVIMSGLLLCFYSDCGWSATSTSLVWESPYTKTPPAVGEKMGKIRERERTVRWRCPVNVIRDTMTMRRLTQRRRLLCHRCPQRGVLRGSFCFPGNHIAIDR